MNINESDKTQKFNINSKIYGINKNKNVKIF